MFSESESASKEGLTMENVACAVCGSDESDVLLDKLWLAQQRGSDGRGTMLFVGEQPVNYRNVCCRQCGLVYVTPRMDKAETIAFYRDSYRDIYTAEDNEPRSGDFPFTGQHLGLEIYNAVVRVDLLDRLGLLAPGIRTLDMGSSLGALPAYLASTGADAHGVEVSPFGAYTEQLFGHGTIHRVAIEEFDDARRFDVVTLCDVLEHLYDPVAVLKQIRELLSETGVVLIEVPDVYKPHKPVTSFFSNAHVYTFSPASIRNLLGVCGLELVHFEYGGYCRNMRVLARRGRAQRPDAHDSVEQIGRLMLQYDKAYDAWRRYMAGKLDYPTANAIATRAIPGYNVITFYEGGRHFRAGHHADARACFARCLASDFNEEHVGLQPANLHALTGMCAFRSGDTDGARFHLRIAFDRLPRLYDFPYTENLERRGIFDMQKFCASRDLLYSEYFSVREQLDGGARHARRRTSA